MKPSNGSKYSIRARSLGLLLIGLLVACADSSTPDSTPPADTAGIGGTGIVYGKITGFSRASISGVIVNGIEFNTDSSSFIIDGTTQTSQSSLAVGMVVKVSGNLSNDNVSGTASTIEYDDEIQGPVADTPQVMTNSGGNKKSFKVFGQTIVIDQTETIFVNTTFDTLAMSDLVEVSGFRSSATDITATYVEKISVLQLGKSEVEVKGSISHYSDIDSLLTVSGIDVSITTGLTQIDADEGLSNGLYVEVKGTLLADNSIRASKIEVEEGGFDSDAGDISLQGLITDYESNNRFNINGLKINAAEAVLTPTNASLSDGINVEVKGSIIDGILVVDTLELREGSIEIEAFVYQVDREDDRIIFKFPGEQLVSVSIVAHTLFEDDKGSTPEENLSLLDISIDDYLKVDGIDNNGGVVASHVRRKDPGDRSSLQGTVTNIDLANSTITLLGIDYRVDAETQYEPIMDTSSFFNQVTTGQLVEITDDSPADGIADEVELKN